MSRSSETSLCRLVVDSPARGEWNMAVDEVLADWAAESGGCALRFYSWSPATLSLGYFQPHASRVGHRASRACPLVRRPSGGGAILHDDELTYSFAVAEGHHLAADAETLYRTIHDTLIVTLRPLGIEASLCERALELPPEQQPFLCFERRARGDVLIGEAKIAGSAQRRQRGAILQHGSVILGRSESAPEIAGIVELSGVSLRFAELQRRWCQELQRLLWLEMQAQPLSNAESRQAEELAREKYASADWIKRK